MTPGRAVRFLLLAMALVPRPALASRPVPVGPEFQVSSSASYVSYGYVYTNGYASDPSVATGANGEFVVVWERYFFEPSSQTALFGRRFARDGTPKMGPFQISPFGNDEYLRASLAIDATGDIIAVWSDVDTVYARRFSPDGTALGPPVPVNTSDVYANAQNYNGVILDPDGNAVVVWDTNTDVRARRLDPTLTPLGAEFVVNGSPALSAGYADIASDAAGNFIVTWEGECGTPAHICARRFDATGTPLGPDFAPALTKDPDELGPRVAMDRTGRFALMSGDTGQGELFDAAGVSVGAPFEELTASFTNGVYDRDGNLLFVWTDDSGPGNMFARMYDSSGQPTGPAVQLSQFPFGANHLWHPEASADPETGDFVVVWVNDYSADYGGYLHNGVFGRRVANCGNGIISPGTSCDDGNTDSGDGCSPTCDEETCFRCTGEPSACTAVASCDAVCSVAAAIDDKATLTIKRIAAPAGDEGISLRGAILNPPVAPGAFDPSADGMEIAIAAADAVYVRAAPTPVPPGPPGSGCGPFDGWKRSGRAPNYSFTYKNKTNALPPTCTPGSANGLRIVKLKDRLARGGTMQFDVEVKNAALPPLPPAPMTATIVLGQSPGADAAGRCARMHFSRVQLSASTARYFP